LFDEVTCTCRETAICPAIACPPGHTKNPFNCACELDVCDVDPTTVFCEPGTLFNEVTCTCQEPAICPAVACPPGHVKNPFTCACETVQVPF
jgi:hypothetical protein